MNKHFYVIILIPLFIFSSKSWGSTIFCLEKEGSLLIGKSTGWSSGFGYIIINKRNIHKKAFRIGFTKRARWTSKYGSLTFNQVAQDLPSGGINEKGLVIEVTSNFRNTSEKGTKPKLSEVQWVQYQLDNFSTVAEVLSNINKVQIKQIGKGLSYFLCDKSGNKAIIEVFDKKLMVIDKELIFPALTNTPYKKCISFLNKIQGKYKTSKPQSSINRFVASADFIKVFKNKTYPDIDYAFKSMLRVKQNNTVWNIVYDLKKMKVYIKTKENNNLRYLDINSLDFNKNSGIEINAPISGNINEKLIPYTIKNNKKLVNYAYKTLVNEGSIKGVYKIFVKLFFIDKLKRYPNKFKYKTIPKSV